MTRKWVAAATVLMCIVMGTSATAKDQGRGKGMGKHEGARWEHRDRDIRWERDRSRRPAGWSKGKKKGWGNCNLPPGQAKKQGCNGHYRSRDRVVIFRDRDRDRRTGGWRLPSKTTTTTTTTRKPGGWHIPDKQTTQTTTTTTTQPSGGWKVPK